jgi:di/tricarboxylate transporter
VTPQIGLLLLIIAAALVLFSLERISADVIALGALVTLALTGLVPANQAFAGFGSDVVMMILGLLILTAALLRTGVVEMSGRALLRLTGKDPHRVLVVITIAVALLSAFISNTAATAFFLPIAVGIAARAGVSLSKLLMPLAFSSIVTSSVTLVSTSTNIVISGLMTRYQMAPMGMFELSPVGVPIAVIGLAYMLFFGRRLIPDRGNPKDLVEEFGLTQYLSEVLILPDSKLIGKTLAESGLGRDLDLTVLRIVRSENPIAPPPPDIKLAEGDELLVEGRREAILKIKDTSGIDIKADAKLSDPGIEDEDLRLVEVILLPGSRLIGRTLKSYRFRERYGLQVLAINRHQETILDKMSEVRLRMGDVLLVQGRRSDIAARADDNVFRVLGPVEEKRLNIQRARIAVAIFAGALAAGAFNFLDLHVAVLLGAVLAFLTGCITPEEAYREVEWKALILIGSMLGVGTAMDHTGAAKFLASQIVTLVGQADPVWMLTGFFVFTVLLTQPMSNQAAAVVVLPVAIQTAMQLSLNPRTFAMMIAVAASCSYLTPLEPSCLMVYGPGRYRFVDFLRVGSLLTVLIYIVAILLVPLVWPLRIQ